MDAVSIVALVISGCMFLLSLATFVVNGVRTAKRDTKAEANSLNDINQSLLKANLKLDQVCTTTNDIRTDIRTVQERQREHGEQIVALEAKVNTLFNMNNEIQDRVNQIEKRR